MEDPKIVEVSDDNEEDEFIDCEDDSENDGVPLKFKQSVLRNKSIFEKQLLESIEIDPHDVFELGTKQENEGDFKDLNNKMDLLVLEVPEVDGADDKDVEDNKLLRMSLQMEKVPGCDGVFKKMSHPGEGQCPPVDSIVTVHFNAYLQDEISNQVKSFDSTVLRGEPRSFMRGQGEVIPGLDIAVGTMKKNERSDFIFSPEFGFGELGCAPRITPNAYLYFTIDLIDWVDSSAAEAFGRLPRKMRKDAPFSKVLEAAKSEKEKGTSFFEKQNFSKASSCYRNALNWIQEHGFADEEEEILGQKMCLKLLLDLALVNLKLNKPKVTCINCKEALSIPTKKSIQHAKAYYRFGLALEKLGDYASAANHMEKALKIVPNDPSVTRALMELKKKVRKEVYVEKDLYKKMLGVSADNGSGKLAFTVEDSHTAIRSQLIQFLESNDETFTLPQGLAQNERDFLESEVKRLNLKLSSKPVKQSEDILVISKK